MIAIFVATLLCAVYVFTRKKRISFLIEGKHDVSDLVADIQKVQDVPLDRVGMYRTEKDKNATWAYNFKKCSIRNILSTSNPHARLQYKTDMTNDKHPICDVVKHHIPSCVRSLDHTLRVCSKNWEFKSHFDCAYNKVLCILGSKRFLVFDLYDHPDEVSIIEHTKNMSIDDLKTFLEQCGIRCNDHTLRPGDELHIEPMMYHRVEADESSIILGHSPPLDNMCDCKNKFKEIWPKQKKLCVNNRCIE